MHRLHQRKGAGRPPRVRWALEEAGAPYDYVVLTKDEGCGDCFTIADVVMGGVLDSARQYELLPDAPALHAYRARLDGREAKQRAYAT